MMDKRYRLWLLEWVGQGPNGVKIVSIQSSQILRRGYRGLSGKIHGSLFERIASFKNLLHAWFEFRKGKRKRRDVQEFEFNLEDNLLQLHEELTAKSYLHSQYTQFYVTDPKLRRINKANVRDRVVHQAVFRILTLIFEPSFIFDSYSCRVDKGTHVAVSRLDHFAHLGSGNNWKNVFALKLDIRKFFDSVDHEILLRLIEHRVNDPETLWLVGLILDSFPVGLPLGNVTSQLFANIYLNELDQFVKHRLQIKYYLRYCDDFVALFNMQEDLQKYLTAVREFLQQKPKLTLHPSKIIIRTYRQGIDFLGYVVRPYCRTLRTKTKRRILKKVNQTNLQSYLGVLQHCDGYVIRQKLIRLCGDTLAMLA